MPICSGRARIRTIALCICLGYGLGFATVRASDDEPTTGILAPERETRCLLEDARRLEREGRLEAALRTTGRGLELAPENPRLLRLRARLLDGFDRAEEAGQLRARADSLSPLPADPPGTPLPGTAGRPASTGLLVIVLATPAEQRPAPSANDAVMTDSLALTVAEWIAVRLPGARITSLAPTIEQTIPGLRAWLADVGESVAISSRVERARCLDTIKYGRFGVAVLRLGLAPGMREVRSIRDDETLDASCSNHQVERVIEAALALPDFENELAATATRPAQPASRAVVHELFPELERAIDAELLEGRRRLAAGRLVAARDSFLRATHIDPEHLDARSFLVEVERTRELAEQIAQVQNVDRSHGTPARRDEPSSPEPRSTTAETRDIEAQTEAARSQREDLLASLALLGASAGAPSADVLARLQDSVVPPDDTIGVRRARNVLARRDPSGGSTAEASLALRILPTSDGRVRARYYYDADALETGPILVEEDIREDFRPDRFVTWRDGRRLEVWETDRGGDLHDVHIAYGSDGATIELTRTDRGEPVRVFLYRDGILRSDFQDADEDGRFDEILHFDADGSLAVRERDGDGDGRVDQMSIHRDGRVVRQESLDAGTAAEAP